jgi:hypothetical protein
MNTVYAVHMHEAEAAHTARLSAMPPIEAVCIFIINKSSEISEL